MDALARDQDDEPRGDRRAVLRAAGGFVLSSGGLLLPAHAVMDVAADQKLTEIVRGNADRRRRRQRHRRAQQRGQRRQDQGPRRRNDDPMGGRLIKGVRLTFETNFPEHFHGNFEWWTGVIGWYRKVVELMPSFGTYTHTYETDDDHGAIFMRDFPGTPVFWVSTPLLTGLPTASIYNNGTISQLGVSGGDKLVDQRTIQEYETVVVHMVMQNESHRFPVVVSIRRDADTADYGVFNLNLWVRP